jgi:hypothetical protein
VPIFPLVTYHGLEHFSKDKSGKGRTGSLVTGKSGAESDRFASFGLRGRFIEVVSVGYRLFET